MNLKRVVGALLLAVFITTPLTSCGHAAAVTHAAGLDDGIEQLASGGVAVTDDVGSPAPVVALKGRASAMRFTRWQVQNLVAEADAHNGYRGSDLDALGHAPAGAPGFSVLLGAWLTRGDGPLALYARHFMGAPDYRQTATIVFPSIVVLAFIADIARVDAVSLRAAEPFDLGRWIAAPAAAAGPCSDISDRVSNVVNAVTSAVQANGSGFLSSLWNVVVTIAGTAFSIVVAGVLQSLVGLVTEVATIAATLMQISSMFKPWTVTLTPNPATVTLQSTSQTGAFDATLNAEDVAWPESVADCVTTLTGVKLTDASYKDAPVTWTKPLGIPVLATKDTNDATLRDDKTAHFSYSTITRPNVPDNECPLLANAGTVGITVNVERSDVTKVIDSLVALVANKLPAKLQAILQPYEQPAIDAAKNAVRNFKSPSASATVAVKEYVADTLPTCNTPPPGKASPSPSPSPLPKHSAALPFAPCEQIISDPDIAAGFPNDVMNAGALKPQLAEFLRHMTQTLFAAAKALDVETNGQENDPRIAQQTGCPIGPMDGSSVDALFVALPDYNRPADPDFSSPDCAALMKAQLAHFHAQCLGTNALVLVFDTNTEYAIQVLSSGSGSPGNPYLVMQHLLTRLQ